MYTVFSNDLHSFKGEVFCFFFNELNMIVKSQKLLSDTVINCGQGYCHVFLFTSEKVILLFYCTCLNILEKN